MVIVVYVHSAPGSPGARDQSAAPVPRPPKAGRGTSSVQGVSMRTSDVPSLSTDQVAAFVELARQGSLRRAAEVLLISEQGLRNRLVALEERLKVELYRKARGLKKGSPLTRDGRRFLPHAVVFLEQACELTELFARSENRQVIHVAATQYLIL